MGVCGSPSCGIKTYIELVLHIGLNDATEELRKLEEMENTRRELEKGRRNR